MQADQLFNKYFTLLIVNFSLPTVSFVKNQNIMKLNHALYIAFIISKFSKTSVSTPQHWKYKNSIDWPSAKIVKLSG